MKVFNENEPIHNPKLRSTMRTLKQSAGALEEQVFLEALKQAKLLAPVEMEPVSANGQEAGGESVPVKDDVRIRFLLIHTPDKVAFFPAFTDEEALQKGKWPGEKVPKSMILTLEDYCTMILSSEKGAAVIAINPFEENIQVLRPQLAKLNGKAIPHMVTKDTKVLLGEPKEYPKELVDAVKEYLKSQKGVQKAYLQQMVKDGEESYLMIVDFEGVARKDLFEGIAEAAAPHLKEKILDLVPYSENFGRDAARKVTPFYTKKRFGLF